MKSLFKLLEYHTKTLIKAMLLYMIRFVMARPRLLGPCMKTVNHMPRLKGFLLKVHRTTCSTPVAVQNVASGISEIPQMVRPVYTRLCKGSSHADRN